MRLLLRIGAMAFSLMIAVAGAELAVRMVDGWPLWGRLPLAEHTVDEATVLESGRPDRRHMKAVPLAGGVQPGWYELDPPTQARIPMTPDVAARAKRYPANIYEAFTEWNREYLTEVVCAGVTDYGLGVLDDVYVFEPGEPGRYPIYRHPPSISPPGWFVTNRFGWRGPDLDLNKDGRTIRIAFVGSSATTGPYGLPFSYPEFVGEWLNRWLQANHPGVRAEVMNAARTGIDSVSIAAIVRQEVLPLEPDLVVYYEGGNSFSPLSILDVPDKLRRTRPKFTFRPPTTAEQYSALARRASSLMLRFTATDGREPAKGSFAIKWPASVSEDHPDPDDPSLPVSLNVAVRSLDSIRTAVASVGGELAVESFEWMIPQPHTALDLKAHLALYQYLNQQLWPIRYDQLRRLTTFQNRVFRAYSQKRGVGYIAFAEAMPQDPDLFSDPVHMGEPGFRLQAWIVLQQLLPWVEARIRDGRLPRPMRTPRPLHPAFERPSDLVTLKALRQSCH
jgi:hypothetical protein